MNNGTMIQVEDLVKVYPGGTRAVDGISFSVEEGGFFGFLGPNGAGKSTTMKILGTLLKQTSGTALVAGYDVNRDPQQVRRVIGFAMQEVGLDDLASGKDFLITQGLLYGLGRKEAVRRAKELLELVALSEVSHRKVGAYSGGMRRRVDLVGALVHNPRVLFLDEPTTGLDPQSRLAIWEHLRDLNGRGITIFLTTQMMEEADQLCRRIAIIEQGLIAAEGTPAQLKNEVGGDVLTISLAGGSDEEHRRQQEKARALVEERGYVSETFLVDSGLCVNVKNGGEVIPDLLKLLSDNGIGVTNLSLSRPTLDDVFLKYTGRKIRTDGASGDGYGQMARHWMGLSRR